MLINSARHFQSILESHPPDTTNRTTISQWGCRVHNIVNEKLGKPVFDCRKIGEMWKCGCADDLQNGNQNQTTSIDTTQNTEPPPGSVRSST